MAYINARIRSQVLQHGTEVELFFPNDYDHHTVPEIRGVFTLLHGFGGTGRDWLRQSAACRYAVDNGLILVAPDCATSFYVDMVYGDPWYTFMTEELPETLNGMFRLPAEREKNFIAGLSMGGYGAMMIGMNHPERYAGVASFSGAVALNLMIEASRNIPDQLREFTLLFGDSLQIPPQYDLPVLAAQVSALPAEEQPKLLFTCGREDDEPYYIRRQNQYLHGLLQPLPLAQCRWLEWSGNHEWKFWDRSLVHAIDWFLSPGYAEKKLDDWRSEACLVDKAQ